MKNILLKMFLKDPYNEMIYDEVYNTIKNVRVKAIIPKYRGVNFKTNNKGFATIRVKYIVLDPRGISYFGYPGDDNTPVEVGKVGSDEESLYTEFDAWLSSDTDYSIMALDIASIISKIFHKMWGSGKNVDFDGIEVLGVYSLRNTMDVEEAVKAMLKSEPWLPVREVYKALRNDYNIKVGSQLVRINKLISDYRDIYSNKTKNMIEKKVKAIIKEKPNAKKKDVVKSLKEENFYINKELSKYITNLMIRYSEMREERIEKIMRRLMKKYGANSVNKLVKVYREEGYKGSNADLRRIAKKLLS